jgi:hypothetical protein
MAAGCFKIWPLDEAGNLIDYPTGAQTAPPPATPVDATSSTTNVAVLQIPKPAPAPQPDPEAPDPSRKEAVDIYFGLLSSNTQSPPKDQVDLLDRVQKALRAVQYLFLHPRPEDKRSEPEPVKERRHRLFRTYYIRVYRLAQLGLEGTSVAPDIADSALTIMIADLINDEAGNVKNRHMRRLGARAAALAAPCLLLYVLLRLIYSYWSGGTKFLYNLGVEAQLASSFMILLAGCFLGVWLSYGVRTTTFSLDDLLITDQDRLNPLVRLLFAASLTVIIGIVISLPLVDLKLGDFPLTHLANLPMLAFFMGCLCGISELALPTAVAKRASDFISSIK